MPETSARPQAAPCRLCGRRPDVFELHGLAWAMCPECSAQAPAESRREAVSKWNLVMAEKEQGDGAVPGAAACRGCGSAPVAEGDGRLSGSSLRCPGCGFQTGWKRSASEAVQAWNSVMTGVPEPACGPMASGPR